jgi:drug/metabolite transporter (DMT)-like permease
MSAAIALPQVRTTFSIGILVALATVYVVWGSTYFAIRIALETLPGFAFAAIRFVFAGALLYAFLRLRGERAPTRRQWLHGSLLGLLLPAIGNGLVVLAEKSVGSGIAATMVATVPMWAVAFGAGFGKRPAGLEMLGLLVGFIGVILLNLDGDFVSSPLSAVLLVVASASWAFGSILGKRLDLPTGWMNAAVQMLTGGLFLGLFSVGAGEGLPTGGSLASWLAVLYLAIFGSLIGFSAYLYLLARVPASVATSYAYVNPVVAVVLGVGLGGEFIPALGYVGIAVILLGVVILLRAGPAGSTRVPARSPADTPAAER